MKGPAKSSSGPKPTRRKMPKGEDVLSYWGPELERLGKADQEELVDAFNPNPQKGICFACGWIRPLHKAHILARSDGGSDHPSNIHLLCRRCHATSERLSGDSYWQWFNAQNQWSEALALAMSTHPDLATLFSGGEAAPGRPR